MVVPRDPSHTHVYALVEDRDGNTALFWATMFDRIEIMEALLKAGCNVNHQSRDGSLAIHVAARFVPLSATLLGGGSNDGGIGGNGTAGTTSCAAETDPLHPSRSCRWQRESAAVLLAECGADIEEVDLEGRSALQYAEYERLRLAMEGTDSFATSPCVHAFSQDTDWGTRGGGGGDRWSLSV